MRLKVIEELKFGGARHSPGSVIDGVPITTGRRIVAAGLAEVLEDAHPAAVKVEDQQAETGGRQAPATVTSSRKPAAKKPAARKPAGSKATPVTKEAPATTAPGDGSAAGQTASAGEPAGGNGDTGTPEKKD